MKTEKIILSIFAILMGVIAYQQFQIHAIKKELVKELTSQINDINIKLQKSDSIVSSLNTKMIARKKADSIATEKAKHYRRKIKANEKKHIPKDVIDRYTRDSIRNILTN